MLPFAAATPTKLTMGPIGGTVGVAVALGSTVAVAVAVGLMNRVRVGVRVGDAVRVRVGDRVGVSVRVKVGVRVSDAVRVGVSVRVLVGVRVSVRVVYACVSASGSRLPCATSARCAYVSAYACGWACAISAAHCRCGWASGYATVVRWAPPSACV
jgi:hypothetical protein